ncbi:sulfite exporter TauE/SafE family protein [Vibrio caribbeanicus]|uniref:sulfite exporter TauE/SafE family protein n=1 Tax=Vibrio caribbeanicus TaxID=701175 RepID=UPI0030DAB18D
MNIELISAFTIGIAGAGHCIGMCGGIASMLTLGPNASSNFIPFFYNIGRLIAYACAGAFIGGAVASLLEVSQINNATGWLRIFAALFMILLACYIGRWWHGLVYVEKLGQKLWQYLSPLGRSFLPLKSPIHAIPFGFIWGWLPCGLVYSMLTWSAASGSAVEGALIMLSFGTGTLPAMLFVGHAAARLQKIKNSTWFRQTVAILILSFGGYSLIDSIKLISHIQ